MPSTSDIFMSLLLSESLSVFFTARFVPRIEVLGVDGRGRPGIDARGGPGLWVF